ncbi:hypothetical protein VPH35_116266 [Triticum aestivum]
MGLEIRVVGNDSGEKVSILPGTLARFDREAPNYQKDGYNDFNTFYIQAASGTKGGSSGSPVVDCQGRAVALNAGSTSSSASAFYLPLDRVVRALNLIRGCRDPFGSKPESAYIPRGTLQMTFQHKGFEETRRLGLRNETEQVVRLVSPAGETGMLVVDSLIVTQFLTMESLLDESVGREINLQVERGGTPLTVKLKVGDLHSITPNHFLEVSGAVIHPLSYQQARNLGFKCGLVYVAEPGYMLSRALVPPYSIIKKFARKDIADLGDFIAVISELSRGERVPLEYVTYTARHRNKCTIVTIDQHGWYATPQLYTRNDATGLWIAKSAMLLESPYVVSIHQRGHRDVNSNVDENIAVEGTVSSSRDLDDIKGVSRHSSSMEGSDLARTISGNTSLAEQVIKPALVKFEVHVPPICMIDGVHAKHFTGAGVVIHHSDSLGLIAVDRNTVAISISDIMVSFAAYPIEIPGQVIFLHPFHYFALVAYDPLTLGVGASVIRASKLLTEPALRRGDSVYLVRLIDSLHAKSRKSIVTNWQAINICSSDFPRYHAMNTEVIELDTDSDIELSGVLTDEQGRVQALWASISSQLFGCGKEGDHQFVVGIPIHLISQVLEKIISGAPGPFRLINGIRRPMPFVRLLEVEIYPTLLTEASNYGLSDRWVQALAEKDPERRQVLQIIGCFAGSKAETLCEGDMILAIDKKPITCFLDIENACQKLDHSVGSDGMLNMTIFRQVRMVYKEKNNFFFDKVRLN